MEAFLLNRKQITRRAKLFPVYELTSSHEYKPQSSLNTKRLDSAHAKVNVSEWRKMLAYFTFEITKFTLAVTSQVVTTFQAESKEYTRDYYKARVWYLKPRKIDDVCYSNTFFASITSI